MRQDILNKKKKLLIRICTIFFVSILVVVFWIVFFKNGTLLKTYKDDNIKFNYDNTWKLNKDDENSLALTHKTNAIIEIKFTNLSSNLINASIEQIKEEVRFDIEKQNTGYKLINQEEKLISKNEYQGYKLLYEDKVSDSTKPKAESMIVILRKDNYLCVINFTANSEYFDILLDSFQLVVGRIQIKR